MPETKTTVTVVNDAATDPALQRVRIAIPTRLLDVFVGLDDEIDIIVRDDDVPSIGTYLLTPCCFATGKGMEYETGVGCRGCYSEVDSKFGGINPTVTYTYKEQA